MDTPTALDLIKQGLASHPNLNWDSRCLLMDAVKYIESSLSDKANQPPSPAADSPTAQTDKI